YSLKRTVADGLREAVIQCGNGRFAQALAFMDAFQSALHIGTDEQGQRFDLALELLATKKGWVVVADTIGLIPEPDHIACEGITRHLSSVSSSQYEHEAKTAQQILATSTLGVAIASQRLIWSVVDNYGMGRAEVWHEG